jgi:uncharacterized membrane protein
VAATVARVAARGHPEVAGLVAAADSVVVAAARAAAARRGAGDVKIKRLLKHLLLPPWVTRRTFSPAVMARIEDAVKHSERLHRGELRVVVETSQDFRPLLRGQSPRARACEVFAETGVWDTAANSGVLLYINHADRDIEIVADRGISAQVPQEQWEAICHSMEVEFRAHRFEVGLLEGIRQITELLARHFPATGENPDELGNRPTML